MFHGHKYKVTFLLLYYFPLILGILLAIAGLQEGTASSSSDYYSGSSNSRNVRSSSSRTGGGGGGAVVSSDSSVSGEDSLRREFIKVQILQRLGLSEKPHVDMAHKISKDLVLETLRRTENLNYHDSSSSSSSSSTATDVAGAGNNERHILSHNHNHANNSSSISTTSLLDEETGVANYAKTSEIISFPDKGKSCSS
ncbi:Inhibin beta chain [Orchesella cincta]|uniref:Inhibin beta chain n=1 Tax=Orchesella cincta TaxID=48709 RepID=A0A1D2MQL7_ORCCI|nr:Inhibin beta chain [Orchesella cincta]